MMIFLKNHITILLITITLVSVLIFFFLLGNHASADNGAAVRINGYDSVLIRDGDTLNSIANRHACLHKNKGYTLSSFHYQILPASINLLLII